MDWEAVIGLEIHVQLATSSKLFSGAATRFGAAPNTQACAVDLGLPGILPVINEDAVRMAVMFGLAIGADVATRSQFARKNYFYPDLPKGYQISQYELPIVRGGLLEIIDDAGSSTCIRITRAHLEEDAGKSLHTDLHGMSGIDLNRAGTPLLEVVSEPDLRSAAAAVAYMRTMHTLVRFLGICDGNMQEGSFRCDANVSVRHRGSDRLGTRAEVKNLNSFRFVERAIEFEIARQVGVLEGGGRLVQETRLYDPDRDETRTMRTKEDADDYRYFPDPDLPPLVISPGWIKEIAAALPELPAAKRRRYAATLDLPPSDLAILIRDPDLAMYFEQAIACAGGHAKPIANWITGELLAWLNRGETTIGKAPITPAMLATLVKRIHDGTISGKLAKQVFEAASQTGDDIDVIIDRQGLRQMQDDGELQAVVRDVVAANPDQVAQFRAGKEKVLGFFVGQVMKRTGGKANPQRLDQLMRAALAEV